MLRDSARFDLRPKPAHTLPPPRPAQNGDTPLRTPSMLAILDGLLQGF